jgi:HAD superfamily hydrolase (TIGR01509 family)
MNGISKIEAVIFDLDGTMLDTERTNAHMVNNLLCEMGHSVPDFIKWYYNNCAGFGIGKILERLQESIGLKIDDKDVFFQHFREYRIEYYGKNPPSVKKGLIELLNSIKERGTKMAICSGTWSENIQLKMKSAGVSFDYFETIIGGDMAENAKPHPEPYLLTCERLGIKPENVLAIEDSDIGVESAHAAGCKVILVPDAIGNSQKAKEIAWHVVESLDMIIAILRKETCIK